MRVQFTYNQNDLIDANMRTLRRSKTVRRGRWQAAIFLTIFFWLAIYVVFISWLGNPYLAVIMLAVSTLTVTALYPTFHERAIKKRLRRLCKESYGERDSFQCEVELTPVEIRIRDENTQTVYDCKSIEDVVVTKDSVDLFTRAGGGVVVRDRAFESPAKRADFIALAKQYLAAGHNDPDQK